MSTVITAPPTACPGWCAQKDFDQHAVVEPGELMHIAVVKGERWHLTLTLINTFAGRVTQPPRINLQTDSAGLTLEDAEELQGALADARQLFGGR